MSAARVQFPALLRSEWTKLRSLRSTWWSAALYAVGAGAFGWLAAASTPTAGSADDAVGIALIGFGFAQFVVVVLGAVCGAGEFASGMALASLAAVPRRVRWLTARTAVLAGVVAVLTGGLVLVCWLAARVLTAVPGGIPLVGAGVGRTLVLQVAGASLTGVLALALGVLLRSTAAGAGTAFALVFLLPLLLPLFGDAARSVADLLPVLRVGGVPFLADGPGAQTGLALTAGWALLAWAAAAVLLVRRDL